MIWRINVAVICFLTLVSCKNEKERRGSEAAAVSLSRDAYFNEDYLMEVEALLELQHDPSVKIIDFRKKEYYDHGHISGAFNLWRDAIENPEATVGGMMAAKEQLEEVLRNLGIENSDTVVVYDDRGSCDAARLWWISVNYDFHGVKILNGGLDAWKALDGKVDTVEPIRKQSNFKLPKESSLKYLALKEELLPEALAASGALVIDARTMEEYSGKRKKNGANHAGRIAGSQWVDWVDAVDFEKSKMFKSRLELQSVYHNFNIDQPIIVYCHSGVRSAHTTFVLSQLLGFTDVRNYDGSWTEWSSIAGYPKEKDTVTTIFK